VPDDIASQWQPPEPIKGARVQFQRALVFELADDVGLHFGDWCLAIDEVVMKDLLERN
jgi:hypothetical protein